MMNAFFGPPLCVSHMGHRHDPLKEDLVSHEVLTSLVKPGDGDAEIQQNVCLALKYGEEMRRQWNERAEAVTRECARLDEIKRLTSEIKCSEEGIARCRKTVENETALLEEVEMLLAALVPDGKVSEKGRGFDLSKEKADHQRKIKDLDTAMQRLIGETEEKRSNLAALEGKTDEGGGKKKTACSQGKDRQPSTSRR